jgi:hypothetical protein
MSNTSMLTTPLESKAEVEGGFAGFEGRQGQEDYHFPHFRTKHLFTAGATVKGRGVEPGAMAPDFELDRAGGGQLRLSRLRGKPVLLHFGSFTHGSVEPLKELWDLWGDAVQFVTVLVRQAGVEYLDQARKLDDAERYQRELGIEWPVLADHVAGTIHQFYGGLADPAYLIDVEGRVAFYNMWTHAPTLDQAIRRMVLQRGRGVIGSGVDPTPQVLAALTDGWKGLEQGLPQSLIDLETAIPTSGLAFWLGHQLQPTLPPLTRHSKSLPPKAKAGLAAGAAMLVGLIWAAGSRRRSPELTQH